MTTPARPWGSRVINAAIVLVVLALLLLAVEIQAGYPPPTFEG